MSNFLESKKVRAVLWILGGLIVLFVVFGLGISVGYQRAGFAAGFDRNYYHIFFGSPVGGPAGMMPPPMPVGIHGVVGTVIDVGSSTISVQDENSNEQSVAISSETIIRDGESNVMLADVPVGDSITVIGEPNSQGQIDARFIRIFSIPSSTTH